MKGKTFLQEMQEKYPHLNIRLGRADDPEVSSVYINFFPTSMKSKPSTPKQPEPKEETDESFVVDNM